MVGIYHTLYSAHRSHTHKPFHVVAYYPAVTCTLVWICNISHQFWITLFKRSLLDDKLIFTKVHKTDHFWKVTLSRNKENIPTVILTDPTQIQGAWDASEALATFSWILVTVSPSQQMLHFENTYRQMKRLVIQGRDASAPLSTFQTRGITTTNNETQIHNLQISKPICWPFHHRNLWRSIYSKHAYVLLTAQT